MATVISIYDEVKDAMNFNADDTDISASSVATTYLTEALIDRLTYKNVMSNQGSYTAQKVGTGVYVCTLGRAYWLLPTFTEQSGVTYTINASGSIEVTAGTDTRDSITVTATPVNFYLLMVDIFTYIANHFSRQITQSLGPQSISINTVRDELMAQASYWAATNFYN